MARPAAIGERSCREAEYRAYRDAKPDSGAAADEDPGDRTRREAESGPDARPVTGWRMARVH